MDAMSETLQALTLVSCENDKIILHEDVLKSILESEEAKNRRVAIISIAGMQRKGKSFFLNFVLRYLKSEIAVLLIDTQGLFDLSKNEIIDTYIMVLSTLFSSIQILNHQEDINSSDLKNFEFFAKYGMALDSKITGIKGFQNLMFLVRDWK
ncbi:hypothetical protein B566_EDAN018020, partial [Ephemera danica]